VKSNKETTNVKEQIQKNVEVSKLGIGVSGMKRISNGGIIISCQKKEHMNKLKNEIIKTNQDFVVHDVERRNPCMIFKNVEQMYDKQSFKEDILLQNERIKTLCESGKNLFNVKAELKTKKNNKNFIVDVTPMMRKLLLDEEKVNLGFYRIKVEDCNPLMQCFHCLRYGHTAKRCLSDMKPPTCLHCAGEHKSTECNKLTEQPQCVNCKERNDKFQTKLNINHRANQDECVTRKQMLQRSRQRVNYD
jgi:hypothetical protein